MTRYIVEAIEDYQTIFMGSGMKEGDEKDFKKFVQQLSQPYIEEIKHVIRMDDIDIESLGMILKTIHNDVKKLQGKAAMKGLNLMESAKRLTEEAIRRNLGSQMLLLEKRIFGTLLKIND